MFFLIELEIGEESYSFSDFTWKDNDNANKATLRNKL